MRSQQRYTPVFSCEFYPPHDEEGFEKLRGVRAQLACLPPAFFSVTYGAGGSTRERTVATVLDIQHHGGIEVAPHITCIAATRESVRTLLDQYLAHGIRRLVALRGDLPSGMGIRAMGEFHYANELVEFIRAESGEQFHIEVAAYPEFHPQAPSAERDLDHFQRKVEAGANGAITQYFYNADGYFSFVDSCERRGIDIPIVPGIMPITNFKQLARFSDACGAEIPRWIRRRLEDLGDDREAIRAFGVDVVAQLCQQLLERGAPGLHFYTLNQAGATLAIWERLGLLSARCEDRAPRA
jgi:methylenetetrahydrofolate reductase (NADPH)